MQIVDVFWPMFGLGGGSCRGGGIVFRRVNCMLGVFFANNWQFVCVLFRMSKSCILQNIIFSVISCQLIAILLSVHEPMCHYLLRDTCFYCCIIMYMFSFNAFPVEYSHDHVFRNMV